MSIPRKGALKRIAALTEQIANHIAKMERGSGSIEMAHWKAEVEEWIAQVQACSRHIGRRTEADLTKQIELWQRQLGDSNDEN